MMDALSQFVQPSTGSTLAFLVIVAAVVGMVLWGVRRVAPEWTGRALVAAAAWLALTAGAAFATRQATMAVFAYFGACNLTAILLALSPVGRRLSTLPLAALVGFHAFRLPLEIVLHQWHAEGTMPIQMTWSGQNLDVITGVLALAIALWGLKAELPRVAVIAFEVVGLGLLLNVMRVAATSTPTPLRMFADDPPVLLAWFVPYTWIVSVCVAGALFGHLVLLRRLMSRRAGSTAA